MSFSPIVTTVDRDYATIGRTTSNVSQTKLAAILGLSRNGITKNVDWLKANGYVERVGEPRTGWWRVLK